MSDWVHNQLQSGDRKKQIIQKRFSPVINPDTISIVYLFIMVQQAMQIMQTIMPDPTKLACFSGLNNIPGIFEWLPAPKSPGEQKQNIRPRQ